MIEIHVLPPRPDFQSTMTVPMTGDAASRQRCFEIICSREDENDGDAEGQDPVEDDPYKQEEERRAKRKEEIGEITRRRKERQRKLGRRP